jgi:hypothetical protein
LPSQVPETTFMSEIPSVLIVDDGELDRVHRILEKLGADPIRMRATAIRSSIEKPRDLLIMSWNPTRELPALHDNSEGTEPTRVCIHSQDFLPLRERLRELGVNYLVQSALDDQSLRLFLLHRLHPGPERRADVRLPLGGNVIVRVGEEEERVKLAELSGSVCRVMMPREVPLDEAVTVVLPRGLGGEQKLELTGRVIRSAEAEAIGGRASFSTVVRFEGLDGPTSEQLAKIIGGQQIGTRVTPLQPRDASLDDTKRSHSAAQGGREAESPSTPEAVVPSGSTPGENDQREAARLSYGRKVALVDEGGVLALGRDLSTSGVCITGAPPTAVGTQVTLALYGDPRGEPVVVEATVMRADADELGLRFAELSTGQRDAITSLMLGPSMVESLSSNAQDGRRIVSRVIV